MVILQWPNMFLSGWIVFLLISKFFEDGTNEKMISSAISTVSLIAWSVIEIISGVSPFRRAFGAIILALTLKRVILQLGLF